MGVDEPGLPTLYDWAGGADALRRFIDAFYDRVERDELLTAFFPGGVSEEHRDHVAAWWSEVLGGPTTYTDEHGGYEAMLAHHRDLRITPEQRHRFASTMSLAADDAAAAGGPGVPGGDHRVRRVGHPARDAQLAAGRRGGRRARAGPALGLGRGAAVRRLVRIGRAPTELPGVHLDLGIRVRRQDRPCRLGVGSSEQRRGAQPGGAVVGLERSVGDQLVRRGWQREVGALAGAEADHEVALAAFPATGEVPHGAAQHVAPAAQQHVAVDAGLVARLVEGERAGRGGIGQVEDVHAAGGACPRRRPGSARARSSASRTRPCRTRCSSQQLVAQRGGAGPVAVVAEELHATESGGPIDLAAAQW